MLSGDRATGKTTFLSEFQFEPTIRITLNKFTLVDAV